MTKSNDDNALHAAAGIMGQAEVDQAMVDLQNRKAKTLGQQIARNKDAALTVCVPEHGMGPHGLEMHRIKGSRYHDGSEIYTLDGVPFCKIYPVEFVNDFKEPSENIAGSYTITATFTYEKLEPEA